MKMSFDLSIEQTQKLIMTQQLQMAVKILQLPSHELNEYVQDQLIENPVLEIDSDEKYYENPEVDWDRFAKNLDYEYSGEYDSESQEDEDDRSPLNFVSNITTLKDYLLFQLGLTVMGFKEKGIGEYIIENIDKSGYLRMDMDDAALYLKADKLDIERVLGIIQSFDPTGIGARDLKECLMIQLKQKGMLNDQLEKVVNYYLGDIAKNKYEVIARKLSITLKEAQSIGDIIKSLEPKPGRGFADSSDIKYVIPDVFIDKVDNRYMVTVNEKATPRLIINSYYRDILRNEDRNRDAASYIKAKLDSAAWLIKSIEQRNSTLHNVVSSIAYFQEGFLEKGIGCLRPLTLKEVADNAGVHESTVSRAVNGKYVQTPRGLYQLKFFFTRGFGEGCDDNISSKKIKHVIKSMIIQENENKPLSDQKITEMLKKSGIDIARRTVAKYREEMQIPSACRRKRF